MIILYIAIGGAIGAVLRHVSTQKIAQIAGLAAFPYGTLTVNVVGSLLMGVLVGYLSKSLPDWLELRAFLLVGILGGFTTFSAFSLDTVTLLTRQLWLEAGLYVGASLLGSVAALAFGLYLSKIIL